MPKLMFLPAILAALLALAACAHRPPQIAYDDPPARLEPIPEPPRPVEIVTLPEPLPLPGQLKPIRAKPEKPEPADPRTRIRLANAAAKEDPVRAGFLNAIQVYPYSDGALYQLYTAMLKITDVALQEGEQLVSIAAGDTVRWTIGDTESGTGSTKRVHVLVKPNRGDLPTNSIVINTDRRTYHLEAHAGAENAAYLAAVSWTYPQDELLALKRRNVLAEAAAPVAQGVDLDRIKFRYEISGDHPPWRPVRAFDDGAKVYIEFPAGIAQGELPPLFLVGPTGESELVNYRANGHYYVVDRLFAAAELRLGADGQQVVRISRTDGRPS